MHTVEDNIKLVNHTLRKHFNNGSGYEQIGFERDDLYQIGCIGLIRAIERFDSSLGYAFSTFAVKWITGEIYNELTNKSALVRYPKDIKGICRKILNSELTYGIKEIMDEFNLSSYSANLVLECIKNHNLKSLDEPFKNEGDSEKIILQDTIPSSNFIDNELKMELECRLSILSDKEREVMELALDDSNQARIAEKVGLSQTTVSRYIRVSIEKINKQFGGIDSKIGVKI